MLVMIAFFFLNTQGINLSVLKVTAENVNRMTTAEEAKHGTASKNLLELVTIFERQLRDFVEPQFPPGTGVRPGKFTFAELAYAQRTAGGPKQK